MAETQKIDEHVYLSYADAKKLIGNHLRALRIDAGKSIGEAASGIGISRSHLSGIELGKHFGNVVILWLLARQYRASIDFLITGEGLDRVLVSSPRVTKPMRNANRDLSFETEAKRRESVRILLTRPPAEIRLVQKVPPASEKVVPFDLNIKSPHKKLKGSASKRKR